MAEKIKFSRQLIWKTIGGVSLTIFAGGLFFILSDLRTLYPAGHVIAWTIITLSFAALVGTVIYGVVVERINEALFSIRDILRDMATKDDQQLIKKEVIDATTIIKDTYKLATKDLLNASNELGLDMVYKIRSEVEKILKDKLENAKKEVKLLGISITIISRIAGFKEILERKTDDGVKFQFLFLETKEELYKQRAKDENYPHDNIEYLIQTATSNIRLLNSIREKLGTSQKTNIELKMYNAFPYMPMFIIDNELYVGMYLFGETCAITPMFRFIEKGDRQGAYHTFHEHFTKLWDAATPVQ